MRETSGGGRGYSLYTRCGVLINTFDLSFFFFPILLRKGFYVTSENQLFIGCFDWRKEYGMDESEERKKERGILIGGKGVLSS